MEILYVMYTLVGQVSQWLSAAFNEQFINKRKLLEMRTLTIQLKEIDFLFLMKHYQLLILLVSSLFLSQLGAAGSFN